MEQSSSISNFRVFRTPIILISLYLILEIGLRIYLVGFHTVFNWIKYNPQGILLTDIAMAVDDPSISWKLSPNVKAILKTKPFTTNSLGFRNSEFPVIAEKGKTRIAIMGRSITMGSGVTDDEVYTQVLQDLFNVWKPDSIEIINCGVAGYSLKQMLDYYDGYVSNLKPDMVLIPLSPNDMTNKVYPIPPPLSQAKTSITNLKYHLSYTFTYYVIKTFVKRATENIISVDWKERVSQINKPQTSTLTSESLLSEFISKRDQEGVKCYFFSPNRRADGSDQDKSGIKIFLSQYNETKYLSINDYVNDHIPENRYIYYPDTHPSKEMHALIANALFQQLKTEVFEN